MEGGGGGVGVDGKKAEEGGLSHSQWSGWTLMTCSEPSLFMLLRDITFVMLLCGRPCRFALIKRNMLGNISSVMDKYAHCDNRNVYQHCSLSLFFVLCWFG